MELRHIRYFIRAAEMLHFTHAAESLFVSQPTLSTHIHDLEEELGTPLFDRSARNVSLTPEGTIFLKRSQLAMQSLEQAQQRIISLKELNTGTIQIGALLTFGHRLLPALIGSFRKKHPNVLMRINSGPSETLEANLLSATTDLALSFVPPASEEISYDTLFTEEIFVVVAKDHPWAGRKGIDVQELNSVPFALVSRRWAARKIYDAFLAKHKVVPNLHMELDDLQALVQVLAATKTASLLPKVVVRRAPELRMIPITGAKLTVDYGVLWHTQRHLSPASSAFLDHIRKTFHS
jgi:LysR family cyn operon transcriptional activator